VPEANRTKNWLESRIINCRRLGLRAVQEHVPRARIEIYLAKPLQAPGKYMA